MSLEIASEVGNAAVVDIPVWPVEPPMIWILGEVLAHIFMNRFLQIESNGPKGTNDDIRTHACGFRDVSARVAQFNVAGIVAHRDANLRLGRFGNGCGG